MLTQKQQNLLAFIHQRLQADGVSPSFEEMKLALGLHSKSGIHRLITGLEERGFLRRLPNRARALEIVRLPAGMGANAAPAPLAKAARQGIEGLAKFGAKAGKALGNLVSLPLYGRIAAGTPIEALRDPTRNVEIPPSMVGAGEHYALEVSGDSMIEAGIHDGDIAIIRAGEAVQAGEIVVALVDGHEATLKRLKRNGNMVMLEAANPKYEPRLLSPERVRVQGKLVSLMRRY